MHIRFQKGVKWSVQNATGTTLNNHRFINLLLHYNHDFIHNILQPLLQHHGYHAPEDWVVLWHEIMRPATDVLFAYDIQYQQHMLPRELRRSCLRRQRNSLSWQLMLPRELRRG